MKRLLDSVCEQSFKDFEVIITDDSPGTDVKELCDAYQNKFTLSYNRNNQPLGTPENWNEAIRKANGEWIKLMHDDDWFSNEDSLRYFADEIKKNKTASFIFSAYRNIYLDTGKQEEVFIDSFRYKLLKKNPATLFSKNIIGPPSVVLHRNDHHFFYDANLKWLVDIDFYIRYFQSDKPVYIPQSIINVGMSSQQVTRETFRVRDVEIPENFYVLNKAGLHQLKNILVYDAWWRLLRNLGIKNISDIRNSGYPGNVHPVVLSMIGWQQKLPGFFLNIGMCSKTCMCIHYLLNYYKINQ